jgi:hypothetical protein
VAAAVKDIHALYAASNPAKVGDVPGLVAKYGEQRLLSMVCRYLNIWLASMFTDTLYP